ncbi:MAG: GntR family transcriptional regulator [Ignavibacteriaceae bacterium]
MILKIDFASETPIYEQLKNQIIEGIAFGILKEGEPLPSVRQMAEDIGINLHTVGKTYSILKREGFLIIHKRSGVIVNSLSQMRNKSFLKEIPLLIKPVIAEAYCKGISGNEFLDKCKEIFQIINKGKK